MRETISITILKDLYNYCGSREFPVYKIMNLYFNNLSPHYQAIKTSTFLSEFLIDKKLLDSDDITFKESKFPFFHQIDFNYKSKIRISGKGIVCLYETYGLEEFTPTSKDFKDFAKDNLIGGKK